MRSVKKLGFVALALAAGIQTALAAPYSYLVNWGEANVSAVNMDTQINVANIPLPSSNAYPWYWGYGYEYGVRQKIVANRDGTKLYAAGKNSIAVISTKTNLVETSIPLDDGAHSVVLSPDQKMLYVSNYQANTVTAIDLINNVPIGSIKLGNELYAYGGGGLAVDSSGKYLYISSQGRDSSTTPARNLHVLKRVDLTSSNFEITQLNLTSSNGWWYYGGGGGIAVIGNKVFISGIEYNNNYQHVVYEIDGTNMTLTSTIPTMVNSWGWYGGGDLISDQAGRVFVTSQGYDSNLGSSVHRLNIIDTTNNNAVSQVILSSGESWYGYHSGALALNEKDGELYITQSFRVHIYSINEGKLKGHMGAGAMPMSITYVPNVQPLSPRDCPNQHAKYDPQNRSLSVPRIAIPLLDPITGKETGKIGVFKGELTLSAGIEDFKADPSKFTFIEMAADYKACDARFSYANNGFSNGGSLFLPLVDVASVIVLPGGFQIPGPTEVFEAALRTLAVDPTTLHLSKYYHIGSL